MVIKFINIFVLTIFKFIKFCQANQKTKCIWLIGENRGECVADNGYHFYKFCNKTHPDLPVYFVINKISPFFDKLKKEKNSRIVAYGSLKHMSLFIDARIYFYTHTFSDTMYKTHFKIFSREKRIVYLHHGVLGFKKFDKIYTKYKNYLDIFTVGNEIEKEILVKDIGVDPRKIRLTGYARFDHLKNRADLLDKQILYIPTHRTWIKKHFTQSLLYKNILSFINNRDLLNILENNNIIFKIYLHKEMQKHSDKITINHPNISIVKLGEESPLDLISKSNLMITDYSSVSWDFFYLLKPVIFYRFDLEQYLCDRDSYVPLDKEIIGDITYDEDVLIERIRYYAESQFAMDQKYRIIHKRMLPNLDNYNCQRIFNESVRLSNK